MQTYPHIPKRTKTCLLSLPGVPPQRRAPEAEEVVQGRNINKLVNRQKVAFVWRAQVRGIGRERTEEWRGP